MWRKRRYSTGPIENARNISEEMIGKNLIIQALNNNVSMKIAVRVRVFQLDRTKVEIFDDVITLNPQSSEPRIVTISGVFLYEVQLTTNSSNALFSVFAEDQDGVPIAAQRVLHGELVRIPLNEKNE